MRVPSRFSVMLLFAVAILVEWLVMALLDTSFWFEKKELNATKPHAMKLAIVLINSLRPSMIISPYF